MAVAAPHGTGDTWNRKKCDFTVKIYHMATCITPELLAGIRFFSRIIIDDSSQERFGLHSFVPP